MKYNSIVILKPKSKKMETPRERRNKNNQLSSEEMKNRIVQLFGQELPKNGNEKIEVTEEERDIFDKLKKMKILFGELRPQAQEVYEKLDAKIRMADRGMAENDAENGREWDAENAREWDAENGGEWDAENGGELEEGEIPQELKDFREAWKERIIGIDNKSKEKIIKAAEKIPVKVETESDGSRLIEFKLWWKRWKILDPKLNSHSDDEYKYSLNRDSIKHIDDTVKLWWMRWDDVEEWNNEKLKEYVKEKQREWLHIAKIEEMKDILAELWENAGLDDENDQIAMLMYLTGMDWRYWLSMWNSEKSGSQGSRSLLNCNANIRDFNYYSYGFINASLCMIACS